RRLPRNQVRLGRPAAELTDVPRVSTMSTTIESAAPQTTEPQRTSWQGVMMSVEEFLALPEDGIHRELIHGRVRELGMTPRNRFHSQIEANVTYHLVEWWRKRPKPRGAIVCGEAGFRLKGTDDSLVGIDVAVASAELIATTDPKQKIYNGPPVVAVEILSPSDTHEDIVEAVSAYLEVGTVVWLVDPDFETVSVHQPGQKPQTFPVGQELDGEPYLPGFRIAVAEFFERS